MACFLPSEIRGNRHHCPVMLTKVDFSVIAKPLRWVTMTGINVCKRDGEVNVVQVEVVKTPVSKLFLRQCLDLHPGTQFSRRNHGS